MKNKLKDIIKNGIANNYDSSHDKSNIGLNYMTQKYETLSSFLASLRKGDVHALEIDKFQSLWQDDEEMFYITKTIKKFQKVIPKLGDTDCSFRNIIRGMLQNNMKFSENQNTPRNENQEVIRAEMTPMTAWIANNEHYKRDRVTVRKAKPKSNQSQNEGKAKEVVFSDAVEKFS